MGGVTPNISENAFEEGDLECDDNMLSEGSITRSARTRGSGDAPPNDRRNTHYGDGPPTEGDEECSGIGESSPKTMAEGDVPPGIRDTAGARANPLGPTDPDGTDNAGTTHENKNLCRKCHTFFKLVDSRLTCMHECFQRDDSFVPDLQGGTLDIRVCWFTIFGLGFIWPPDIIWKGI